MKYIEVIQNLEALITKHHPEWSEADRKEVALHSANVVLMDPVTIEEDEDIYCLDCSCGEEWVVHVEGDIFRCMNCGATHYIVDEDD